MIAASVTLWSRSLTWRLLAPVGLMLLLVALLTLVSLGTRARLHRAYDAQTTSQEVRTELIEVRSLSRSLQRDALNLLIETDRRELRVIHGKYLSRTEEMRHHLDALIRHPGFTAGAAPAAYLASQKLVLDRLATFSAQAERGERTRALATFRREVRPNERAASRIADRLIAAQTARVAALRRRTGAVERQEVIASSLASLLLFAAAALATLAIARRSVLRPLSDIEHAMTRVAGGETAGDTPHTARPDEIGRMARAIEVFRGSVRERERLREERDGRRIIEARQELEREQARRRDDEAVAARSAALARSAQVMQGEIDEAVRALRSSSTQLATASRALTGLSAGARAGLDDVAGAVARAVGGATDIAAATDQFTTAIGQASARTRRSADLSGGAAAQSGVLATRMARVQETAAAIETIVNLIAGIAKQTNLLALNASIEAARGDRDGAGFAVVAGEVKQLAGETARATDGIADQIADMQRAAHDAGASLQLIEATIAEMAHEAGLLAASIDEQAHSSRLINSNLSGAVADLDLIDGRVREVAESSVGVETLARQVSSDAMVLEGAAATIDRALSAFFTNLDAVRAAAIERREPMLVE